MKKNKVKVITITLVFALLLILFTSCALDKGNYTKSRLKNAKIEELVVVKDDGEEGLKLGGKFLLPKTEEDRRILALVRKIEKESMGSIPIKRKYGNSVNQKNIEEKVEIINEKFPYLEIFIGTEGDEVRIYLQHEESQISK